MLFFRLIISHRGLIPSAMLRNSLSLLLPWMESVRRSISHFLIILFGLLLKLKLDIELSNGLIKTGFILSLNQERFPFVHICVLYTSVWAWAMFSRVIIELTGLECYVNAGHHWEGEQFQATWREISILGTREVKRGFHFAFEMQMIV